MSQIYCWQCEEKTDTGIECLDPGSDCDCAECCATCGTNKENA